MHPDAHHLRLETASIERPCLHDATQHWRHDEWIGGGIARNAESTRATICKAQLTLTRTHMLFAHHLTEPICNSR